jgi:hypothetical protein
MKAKTGLLFIFSFLIACGQSNKKSLSDIKEKIQEMENAELSQDQIDRRNQSIDYCKKYKIPTIDHLPCIESEDSVAIRSKSDILARALALSYLGLKSEGLDENRLGAYDKKYSISEHFTENEKHYVESPSPTEQQKVDANWRYESLHILLWTLGYIDSLAYPGEMCNVADDIKIIFSRTKEQFASDAKLRSKKEILDQADLIYRIHWACVDARVKNQDPPAGLNASIVYERHYVLNWLIKYMEQDWDDVTTDT